LELLDDGQAHGRCAHEQEAERRTCWSRLTIVAYYSLQTLQVLRLDGRAVGAEGDKRRSEEEAMRLKKML